MCTVTSLGYAAGKEGIFIQFISKIQSGRFADWVKTVSSMFNNVTF